jgi:hypothetical protein
MGHEQGIEAIRAFLYNISVAESQPQYLLLRLMRTLLRLYQRNHDKHQQKYSSFVVYICMPNVNGAWATSCWDMSLPTHHMVAESRPQHLPLCLMRTLLRLYQERNHDMHKQKVRIIRHLHMCAKRKWGMSNELWRYEPSYTPYGCGESTSIAPPYHDCMVVVCQL